MQRRSAKRKKKSNGRLYLIVLVVVVICIISYLAKPKEQGTVQTVSNTTVQPYKESYDSSKPIVTPTPISTERVAAAQGKTFAFSIYDFLTAFASNMAAVGQPSDRKIINPTSYQFGDYVFVAYTGDATAPKSIYIGGSGDGSATSGADILISFAAFISSFEENVTRQSSYDYVTAIVNDGKKLRLDTATYQFEKSNGAGNFIYATPSN